MLKPSTLEFLKDLENNNNKLWFDENRKRYEAAKSDFINLVEDSFMNICDFDTSIKRDSEKSKKIFRINRDVRFSKDKTPYKNNFGAAIRISTDKPVASYYIHIQPGGNSGIGGGIYMPDPKTLYLLRMYVANHADDFLDILGEKGFQETFKDIEGEKSKRLISEVSITNPVSEYTKLKSFTVWKTLTDSKLKDNKLENEITSDFKIMMPLIHFLNKGLKV